MTKVEAGGRLAMRHEGTYWVAYWAMPDTMDKAIELGRIAMAFVQDKERKELFMSMMKSCVAEIFSSRGVDIHHWGDPMTAPETERAGEA